MGRALSEQREATQPSSPPRPLQPKPLQQLAQNPGRANSGISKQGDTFCFGSLCFPGTQHHPHTSQA